MRSHAGSYLFITPHGFASRKTPVLFMISTSEGHVTLFGCAGVQLVTSHMSGLCCLHSHLCHQMAPVAHIETEPPDGTSGSYPDEAPVEDVEDDEGHGEQDATALVNPLGDLLRGHRGEAGVVRGRHQCGDGNHQVSVARVVSGLHARISSHCLCGIDGERVAVALKQEATAVVADRGTTLRLQTEMSRTALPHVTSTPSPIIPSRHPAVLFHTNVGSVSHRCRKALRLVDICRKV